MPYRLPLLLALLVLVPGAASLMAGGPVVGDVVVTRTLQALLGETPAWAGPVTDMAKAPWLWASMVLAVGLAFLSAGGLRAFSPLLAYGFAWGADQIFRSLIYVSRPDAALVHVASASSSSGLPSTFGLVFGALFGVALWMKNDSLQARIALAVCFLLMLAGGAARIVLGGHWLSQMLPSFALGILLAGIAVWVFGRIEALFPGKVS
ncbi:putative membrane protein [Hyphomonas neptunium ATCC 15444]|uniref:Phosphatidic acid phosphatase type 2/haloperoxidase domain-containing protein n=2 Tax=Hyphomonas TaxID=85 RepID=A0A059G085_9PROT|nr:MULTISPECIES: phosphatase PAP2 family protein [Hyphomonas]ABI78757.1 putative membrane protein [Hyphomonas neptunium ATCC 15444]KCZ96453.1 hypothetical protein HHI_02200 [Hyphomonas hirschiana VP5]